MAKKAIAVAAKQIEEKIFLIRGEKVILDRDLAELYQVETKQLKRAVRRNMERFPEDFMFELTKKEFENLRYHFGTSSWGGTRYMPLAFTEEGVAMLSSVLRSKRAAQVNIEIIRALIQLRRMLDAHKDLRRKLAELEKKYDDQFKIVFEAIAELMTPLRGLAADIRRRTQTLLSSPCDWTHSNYLKATGVNMGLLINFKHPKAEIKRFVLNLPEGHDTNCGDRSSPQ